MTDKVTKSEQQYNEVFEKFSDDFKNALVEKASDITRNFLVLYGDPKQFREVLSLAGTLAESVTLWLVAEDYVSLNPDHETTDEERARRAEAKSATGARPDDILGQLAEHVNTHTGNGYL